MDVAWQPREMSNASEGKDGNQIDFYTVARKNLKAMDLKLHLIDNGMCCRSAIYIKFGQNRNG